MKPKGEPEFIVEDSRAQNAPAMHEKRGQWANKKEVILAVVGEIIGLGNVWRFPYLCFKNGGGAFLICYTFFLVSLGIPGFFLEVSLGQLTGQGVVTCWRRICPLMEGIGYGIQVIAIYMVTYYIVILAWGFFYLFASFHAVLPWVSCNNTWNTENCIDHRLNESYHGHSGNATSVKEFWQRRVLGLSAGIEVVGGLRWDLAGCLLLSWVICYFCIFKGVKSTGKVVYLTASFPYLLLLVMLIRGLTLPGAMNGIQYYLYPDIRRLADPQVWLDAGSQILFSNALCESCVSGMGSYNKYNNNCYKDAVFMTILNSLTSFFAGFVVFSILGFMSFELGVDISKVAESGPGLAFLAYPRAAAAMPFPNLWAVLFFLIVIFLGLDSEFVCLEGLVTSISDMFPSFFLIGQRRKLLLLFICVVCFCAGLTMVTEGGLYVFLLFDKYACSGIPILCLLISQVVTVAWLFGVDSYYDKVKDMIGYYPSCYMKYCWKFITPLVSGVLLIISLVKFRALKYDNTYNYPWWGYAIGILLAFLSILPIPLFSFYAIAKTPGSLKERMKTLCTPAAELHDTAGRKNCDPGTSKSEHRVASSEASVDLMTHQWQ